MDRFFSTFFSGAHTLILGMRLTIGLIQAYKNLCSEGEKRGFLYHHICSFLPHDFMKNSNILTQLTHINLFVKNIQEKQHSV